MSITSYENISISWIVSLSYRYCYSQVSSADDHPASIAVIMDSGFDWTIEVPEIELLEISTWEFEVFASGVSPNDTDFQYMRSPAFVILPRSTSAPPKYNDSIASTCSPTVVTNYVQKSSDLSTGAKAGIAVGAVAGAIALFTSGWIVASWRGRKRAHNSDMARRLDPDLPKPPVSIPESPIEKDSTASPNFVQKKALPESEPVLISVNEQRTPRGSMLKPPVETDSGTWPEPLRIKPGPRSEALGGESNEQSTTKLSPPEEPGRTSSFNAARCRSPIEMPVCPWRDE